MIQRERSSADVAAVACSTLTEGPRIAVGCTLSLANKASPTAAKVWSGGGQQSAMGYMSSVKNAQLGLRLSNFVSTMMMTIFCRYPRSVSGKAEVTRACA